MNSPSPATLINGQPAEQVSVAERALHYGDGLFETISCCEGSPRWLARHLQRLRTGCERLQITFLEEAALRAEVSRLARGQARCIVKVIVSRGVATRRGYRPAGDEQATRIVSRHEWPSEATQEGTQDRPLRVGLSAVSLGVNPRLAGLKHLNRLEQVLAQLDKPVALDEVLMRASSGELIGGSMCNVFLVDEHGPYTPAVDTCGVAGVMRSVVLDAAGSAAQAGLSVAVRPVRVAELDGVREAFVTNVRWGIRSIGVLDGRRLPSDDCAQQLRRLIDAAG